MSITAPRTAISDINEYPRFNYTRVTHEMYRVVADHKTEIVIVGDPANGCYEWMLRSGKRVERHSDMGYGEPALAMRDGLIAYYGLPDDLHALSNSR